MTAASVMQHRSNDEHRRAEELRAQSDDAVKRLHAAADRIRRMTKIYQERLDGVRRG